MQETHNDFALTLAGGPIVQVDDFYPYGMAFNHEVSDNAILNRYLYQGKEKLSDDTDWYDFHARLYSPALGRFLGVDPQGQFANPYNGMGNNPMVYVDPDGEFAFIPILIGAAIGGTINLGFQALNGKIDKPSDAFKAFGVGALAGGAAVLAPQLIGSIGNIALTQTTASIFTNGAVASGIIPGAVSGAVGGAVGNFGNALAFQNASLKEAGISALWGAASGALVGGTIGYFTGKANGSVWGPSKTTSVPVIEPLPGSGEFLESGNTYSPDGKFLGNTKVDYPITYKQVDLNSTAGWKGLNPSDGNHYFSKIVDNSMSEAAKFTLKGGDGVYRSLYQIRGILNGKSGIFEWIVEAGGKMTHRIFIPGGKITGIPNVFK